ncbi:MAG: YfhO family protein [Lachnospiraceae bacterium]|nr:YfhO family protein [Lachnospiraceae bacterium]
MSKSKIYRICFFIAAGLIPLLVFLAVFMIPKVTQGNYTVLTSDLNGQYINYLVYFRNAILNGENITYSFSSILGGETMALIGYYVLSPLNLLFLVFPVEEVSRVAFYIIALKVLLAGITSACFFGRKNGYALSSLIFSTSYALSGYIFAYFMHMMWLDSFYMLPLVAIGLEKLVSCRKSLMYILTLTYTFIVNYYTGYMVAGFCVIYFAYLLISEEYDFHEVRQSVLKFIFSSLSSGMLSAVTLIPTAISQLGSRETSSSSNFDFTASQYLSKLFTSSFSSSEFSKGAPNIYCGVLILQLVILSLISFGKKYSVRKKIAQILLLSAFILSFTIEKLDLVWHLLSKPHSFTYRYSFIFVFAALIVAQDYFEHKREKLKLWQILLTDVICISMIVFVRKSYLENVDNIGLYIDLLLVLIFSNILYLRNRIDRIKVRYDFIFSALILIIHAGVLYYNASTYMSVFTFDDKSEKGYYNSLVKYVDYVKYHEDDGLYRIEKGSYNTINDSWLLSYNGLSSFSSSDKEFVRNFTADLGYNKSYYWGSYDQGASLAADSLLGIKYFITSKEAEYYDLVIKAGKYAIYKNPYAFEFGFAANKNVKETLLSTERPFENQNRIFSGILGKEVTLFDLVSDFEISSSENVKLSESDSSEYMFSNRNTSKDGIIHIHFKAENNNKYYLFISSTYEPNVRLSVNGVSLGSYLSTNHQGMIELGKFEAMEEVDIAMKMSLSHCGISNIQIASFDEDAFVEAYNESKGNNWSVKEHGNNFIKASISNDEDSTLFLTIPYNSGWKATIDGEKVEIYKLFDTLMGIDLEKGTHEVMLKYEVVGLKLGILVSLLGIALFILIMINDRKEEARKWQTS